ncbi:pantoate--beta-alanine ligase [Chthonobacter rhizosphaerae]|uniref:pantoate--beta-alanine ligase n=1 Tax=Chthonobacter rhizosphaerae TaxID=2735553 RepID=UPI0015EE4A2F|nr:pantoate--beta-alanine ligase [Chthonobacter rhizosphaerae]
MEVLTTIADVRRRLEPHRRSGRTIGLVPTMGFLHVGHMELVRRAREANDMVVATIFVNPLQFGPNEDFARYPRDMDRDQAMLRDAGVDILFAPPVEEMYPAPLDTAVDLQHLGSMLEGERRPGHFRGVATVVTKLFNIAQPTRAYFGEKDYQQLAVIRRMVRDLSVPVDVVGVPTVRESDGVACSSRNVYLSPEERAAAPVLSRALAEAEERIAKGQRDFIRLRAHLEAFLVREPLADPDLVEIRDAATLNEARAESEAVVVLLAVRFGRTRLLDQRVIPLPRSS